jgi:EmrB/QacA subfamily drug resistance transporter
MRWRYSSSPLLQCSVAVASLSALLGSLDSSVNIAFPAITQAFSLQVASIQWVVVSYVLTHASLLLGCGRLADLWGHGRLLTFGLIASAVAFVGCGLAPSFSWLIAARAVQGVAVALVFGSAPALVTLAVPIDGRGHALGIFQMSAAVGYAMGPLIGGLLLDAFGWRAVFLFRVVPALLLAWLAAAKLPLAGVRQRGQRFDFLGALTLAGSVAGFLLGVSRIRTVGWASAEVLIHLLLAGACLVVFFVTELRVRAPVVDLSLFRRPPFVIANLLTIMANCARFAIGLLIPYYLIEVLRYPAITGGSLMLVAAMTTTLAAPVAGRLSDHFGTARLSSAGLALEGLGLWMMSRLNGQAEYLSVAVALSVVGLGLGVFEAPNLNFVMSAAPPTQQGVAGAIANMMRTLGIVFGATGASVLFEERQKFYAEVTGSQGTKNFASFVPAFQDVFLYAAGLCVIAFGLSLFRRQVDPAPAAGQDR